MATLAQEMNGGTNGGNEVGRKLSMSTPGSSLSLSKFYCFVLQDNVHVHVHEQAYMYMYMYNVHVHRHFHDCYT